MNRVYITTSATMTRSSVIQTTQGALACCTDIGVDLVVDRA